MTKYSTLYVLCGCPGCGKSTWANTRLKENTHEQKWEVISRDAIRFAMVGENQDYFSRENEVFDTFIQKIVESIKNPWVENTIADATHLNKASRRKLIDSINRADKELKYNIVYVYFDVSARICVERNEKRTGRANVPRDRILKMHRSMEFPGIEYSNLIGIKIVRD